MTTIKEAVKTDCQKIEDACEDLGALIDSLDRLVQAIGQDASVSPAHAAESYFYIRNAHVALDRSAKALYALKDRMDKQICPSKMEAVEIDMLRLPHLARSFSVVEKISASLVDKPRAFEWLRSIDQGDIIQETVNAGTLASLVRNLMLEEGIEPPPDAVRVNTYNTTSVNKYTPK